MDGDNANLDEFANYYGVTAVCAVNERDTRSSYSEMGANLWVCAPWGDRAQDYRGIVHHGEFRPPCGRFQRDIWVNPRVLS